MNDIKQMQQDTGAMQKNLDALKVKLAKAEQEAAKPEWTPSGGSYVVQGDCSIHEFKHTKADWYKEPGGAFECRGQAELAAMQNRLTNRMRKWAIDHNCLATPNSDTRCYILMGIDKEPVAHDMHSCAWNPANVYFTHIKAANRAKEFFQEEIKELYNAMKSC